MSQGLPVYSKSQVLLYIKRNITQAWNYTDDQAMVVYVFKALFKKSRKVKENRRDFQT